MRQKLKVSVSKQPQMTGVITCRSRTIRERFLSLLFGDKKRVTILIPGDNVDELAICEMEKGEEANGKGEIATGCV